MSNCKLIFINLVLHKNFLLTKNQSIMGMISEFKAFSVKGNVVDLAIGVVIGAAFAKIVSSLIEDVITPLLLKPALKAAHLSKIEELTVFGGVKYGMFISSLINFVIIAFVLFIIIKGLNAAKRKEPVVEVPVGPTQEQLLTEIRDLLKK